MYRFSLSNLLLSLAPLGLVFLCVLKLRERQVPDWFDVELVGMLAMGIGGTAGALVDGVAGMMQQGLRWLSVTCILLAISLASIGLMLLAMQMSLAMN